MKIIKKTKQFVKEHKKLIVTGIGVICGGVCIFKLGTAHGMNRLGKNLSKGFGVNLKDEYCYTATDKFTLKDLGVDDEVLEMFKQHGFTSLDDKVNAAIIIQKQIES